MNCFLEWEATHQGHKRLAAFAHSRLSFFQRNIFVCIPCQCCSGGKKWSHRWKIKKVSITWKF